MKYLIKYKVRGFGDGHGDDDQQAGPYDTAGRAEEHRQDINGYEGVYDCRVVSVEE